MSFQPKRYAARLARMQRAAFRYMAPADRPLERLPEFEGMANVVAGGRSAYEGYQRGWGLEFGTLMDDLWRDPLFRMAYRTVRGDGRIASLVSVQRLANLFLIIKFFFARLDSQDIVEFGSYRGGSAVFMGLLLRELYPNARLYALDTFEGMPDTAAVDLHGSGDFKDSSLARTKAATSELGLTNIEYVQGLVEDTIPPLFERAGPFGLAHIDLDIYEPIVFSQEAVWPRMTEGGYVIYDDATVSSCIGATQAVEEMIRTRGVHSEQIFPHFVFRAGLNDAAPESIG